MQTEYTPKCEQCRDRGCDGCMKTDFKVYKRKIDIYLKHLRDGKYYYECSSMAYRTLKECRDRYCQMHGLDKSQVKIVYSK